MKLYFDTTQINNDDIMGLSQQAYLFDETFKLGSTVCRQVNLQVNKSGVATQPSMVYIKDDSNNTLFTLQVDNIDDTNNHYYDYTLTDKMINLNVEYNWSALADKTVQGLVNDISTRYLGSSNPPTVTYMGDLVVTWNEGISARDLVSYIAEVNSSFARINANGDLEFVQFTNSNPKTINVEECADFGLGEYHQIDRVVVDLGTATVKCPIDAEYTGTHNTVYLNSDNILLTDSQSYTITGTVEHIYNLINGFKFYCAETTQAVIDETILAGTPIKYVLGSNEYISIAQIDWTYMCGWRGGYILNVDTKKQEETQIISGTKKYNSQIRIIVDRELGEIRQEINRVNEDLTNQVTSVKQTADGLSISVAENKADITDVDERVSTIETNVDITNDGVKISKGTPGNYTNFTDEGMDIYVEGNKVANATKDGFNATEFIVEPWHITTNNDGNSLNFFRRDEE